jgi:hypothetical protein
MERRRKERLASIRGLECDSDDNGIYLALANRVSQSSFADATRGHAEKYLAGLRFGSMSFRELFHKDCVVTSNTLHKLT